MVPKELDLHGAAQALIRLQDVYELDIAEIAGGKIGQSRSAARLSAQDCLFIGEEFCNGLEKPPSILCMDQSNKIVEIF